MTPQNIAEHLTLGVDLTYRDFVEAHFIRLAYAEGLMTIVGAGWTTRADLGDTPGEMLGRADYFHSDSKERVVRLDRALCHLILNERSLVLRVAARNATDADAAVRAIADALPEVDHSPDPEVPVRFWWWAPGPQQPHSLARMLPSPPWTETETNYVGQTRAQLAEISRWGEPPSGGRLLLWHGDPGTGKTSAIRSLTSEWRSWAEFQFVTDPEEFLSNPGYLLQTISPKRGPRRTGSTDIWKIVVLEDAGEFLAPDAKHLKGQALSRLLNVCDGVLGQAMRALVLVTTNEPLSQVHPALTRPGRCLADVAFERFGRHQIADWCSANGVAPPDTDSATVADLYAHLDGRQPAPERRAIGFASAAT